MGLANKIPDYDRASAPGFPADGAFGVYVHVPFCAHTCDFCAFYQVEPRRGDIERYLETVKREMALVAPPSGGIATAFWGGGTPGLLPPRDLATLARTQLERFGPPRREWSVELAPGSVSPQRLEVLHAAGVTRVSLGVQTFDPRLLEALGRQHSLEQIRRAWTLVRAAGFASVNLDLIFAVPGQTLDDWRADLTEAVRLEPDHISTYCLTFEEDARMYVRLAEGRVNIDPEREREFYQATWEVLGAAGYEQYEISNFARPGHACVHNLNTWRMQSWAGFGPSAASQHEGWRGANPSDLARWIEAVERGERGQTDRIHLTTAQLAEDALIFGLRMNEGVDLAELRRRFGGSAVERFTSVLDRCVAEGVVAEIEKARYVLTAEGRLVADAVAGELMAAGADAE